MTKAKLLEREESIRELTGKGMGRKRPWLQPGDIVYTILRHTSASGMSREITPLIFTPPIKGYPTIDPRYLTYHVGRVVGLRQGKHDGLVIGGCGMDMGFQLVYLLGSYLWPKGTPKPHGKRNGTDDTSGGYALKQRWL